MDRSRNGGGGRVSKTQVGLKLVSVVISIVTIGCAAAAVYYSDFFMAIVSLGLILSVGSIICQLVISDENKSFKLADSVYHVFFSLFLIGSSIHYFVELEDVVSTSKQEMGGSEAIRNLKIDYHVPTGEAYAAGSIAIVNAVVSGIIAFLICKN